MSLLARALRLRCSPCPASPPPPATSIEPTLPITGTSPPPAVTPQLSGEGDVSGTLTITGAPKGFEPVFEGVRRLPGARHHHLCRPAVHLLERQYLRPAADRRYVGYRRVLRARRIRRCVPRLLRGGDGHRWRDRPPQNLTVPYQKPAGIRGQVTVTGLPKGHLRRGGGGPAVPVLRTLERNVPTVDRLRRPRQLGTELTILQGSRPPARHVVCLSGILHRVRV